MHGDALPGGCVSFQRIFSGVKMVSRTSAPLPAPCPRGISVVNYARSYVVFGGAGVEVRIQWFDGNPGA